MSWSLSVTGNMDEIGQAFDNERNRCAESGMLESEQRDIEAARNLAMQFASKYERVSVSASGHWSLAYKESMPNVVNADASAFGRMQITIDRAF